MIKINQIRTSSQIQRLAPFFDIAGICVSATDPISPHCLHLNEALELRQKHPDIAISVAIENPKALKLEKIEEVLKSLNAQFFEFTPEDFSKENFFVEEVKRYSQLKWPKIANGFFVLPDDTSPISTLEPYKKWLSIDVQYFQLEISSALQNNSQLSAAQLQLVSEFCSQLPVLITDEFKNLKSYPDLKSSGSYFNLHNLEADLNYDLSRLSWQESQLFKLFKNI